MAFLTTGDSGMGAMDITTIIIILAIAFAVGLLIYYKMFATPVAPG